MSTKGSYFLTKLNEHWYHDCSDNTNCIEIEIENIEEIKYNFDTLDINLKPDTELYSEIKKIWKKEDFYLSIPFKNIESYEVCQNKYDNYIIILTAAFCNCDYEKRRKGSSNELNNYIKNLKNS